MGLVEHNGIKFLIAGKSEQSITEQGIYFTRAERATELNIIG